MSTAILQCGTAPAALEAEFGSYGAMMRRLLAREATVLDATRGELPEVPDAFDACVLTGSPSGVYDGDPWITGLLDFLRRARGRTRLVGICFGHQAMAQAWGGRVAKAPAGWGIGLQRYDVVRRAPWMDGAASVAIPASHQDQVLDKPADAEVVLANAFTPVAGLDYGDAISFQFHPEFNADFGTALIRTRLERYGSLAAPAIESYKQPDDCARVGGWISRFLDG